MKPLIVLNGLEYFSEITRLIALTRSGDRVGLMTMSFDPSDPLIKSLFNELFKAAKRGVRVQVSVDAHSFMIDDVHTRPTGPLFKHSDIHRSRRADFRSKYESLEKLRASGGYYCITNMPKRRLTNPFSGRSHIKMCVINNSTYLGGSNLSKSDQIDMMVRVSDASTADFAWDFLQRVVKSQSVLEAMSGNDVTFKVDEATTIFIDAGVKKQSLIYAQALNFIDQANEWITLTCQFFPGNPTSSHLANALKRGVNVDVYFQASRVSLDLLSVPHYMAELTDRIKQPKELFKHPVGRNIPRLHAKLLASEQGVMIGSHNYVPQGVNFGTAEIMLFRRSEKFALTTVKKLLASLKASRINKNNLAY
jgi:phosphatidylserine/phosphatidylglycerophosphate/cardiolipin synthase-like enzyme